MTHEIFSPVPTASNVKASGCLCNCGSRNLFEVLPFPADDDKHWVHREDCEAGLPHRTCISYISLDIVWESFKNNLALHYYSIACIAFEKTAYKVYLTSLVISSSLEYWLWHGTTGWTLHIFKSCAVKFIQPAAAARIASQTRWALMVSLQDFSSCWLTVTIKDVFSPSM